MTRFFNEVDGKKKPSSDVKINLSDYLITMDTKNTPITESNQSTMEKSLKIYNSLSRKKEVFEPLNPPFVGMYVCGPTVYSDVHLGNVRAFVSFDVVYRYLSHLNYKVRYVRNITDVGHLVNDADEGEDKIAKKARLENLEPMEVVQQYTNGFHQVMLLFNAIPPSIEPTATGHLLEQIEMIQRILDNGYAYESNGSVYFDVEKYNENHPYGKLSGRKIEDLRSNTRELDGQSEKRNPLDFAIWKKASPEHIMRWNSPWSVGFPGWHLECSVMSTKYLGQKFDIHGGGMDLRFPHHECEIAQSVAADGEEPVRYWMHSNMLTVNGTKMSKSLNNSFLPHELISGNHPLLTKGYSPMTIRFFMLQSHYASEVDFSNDALQASEKGFYRLMNAYDALKKLAHDGNNDKVVEAEVKEVKDLCQQAFDNMNDDFNTPQAIARLFDLSKKINSYKDGQISLNSLDAETFVYLQKTFEDFIENILGLKEETAGNNEVAEGLMDLILEIRKTSRANKDWGTSDQIRDVLNNLNIVVKDGKEGTTWSLNG